MNTLLPKIIGQYINTLFRVSPEKATELAFELFSKPRKGFFNKNSLPNILKSSKVEYLTCNQKTFPVYQWQQGSEHVLLVHGWESNAARWEPLINLLIQRNFSVTCFDGPAHGMAEGRLFSIPEMASFINIIQNKFEIPYLVGHSVGGTASLYYQHLYKDQGLKKMAVLGAPSDLEKLIENFQKLLGLHPKLGLLLIQHFEKKIEGSVSNFSGKLFVKDFELSGLIYHDELDDVVLLDEAYKIANHWEQVTLKTTRGLGHSMHDETMYLDIIEWLKT
jgi:esterase/lipase